MNRGELNRRSTHVDERNYAGEAQELIRGLTTTDLYRLYEIVDNEKRRASNDERVKELDAVEFAIESHKKTDAYRLNKIKEGQSPMARDARAKDGQTTKHHKKV